MNKTHTREPVNSTSVSNADRLFNNLSESDKALIEAMMNTAFVLLKSVQRVKAGSSSDVSGLTERKSDRKPA